MEFLNKGFLGALFLSMHIYAYSQNVVTNPSPEAILQETEISLDDDEAVAPDSLMNVNALEVSDSTDIPAAKLYRDIWDNRFVNPYQWRGINMPDTVHIDFSQYCHPNKNVVTSEFGFRRGWRFHYGIDTRLTVGDSIRCSFDGMVRIAQRGRAYGNYIVIRHFNGLETVYGHLSKMLVNVNQVVHAGEVIGLGGSTGRSTGPHLHYEVRYLGQPIPPRELIDFDNYTAKGTTVDLSARDFAYARELEQVRYYTVRKGDTLSGIAGKVGVSMEKICSLNKIKKNSILRIGQKLRCT